VLAGAGWAFWAWPRIGDVRTGQTPEYPDLQDRFYSASEERVARAVKELLGRLPGWTFVGGGQGPGGHAFQGTHRTLLGTQDDVTVSVRREGGKTRVSVRSRSRGRSMDFGQNARNVREFLVALDREVS
jgi:hypothetical protein